jgi:hypothetical protein
MSVYSSLAVEKKKMSRRVFYLMSGAAHCPYLVVSLRSLREAAGYDGEIEVHAWADSIDIVNRMSEDDRLRIKPILREPAYRGKNDQFLDKIRLAQTLDGTNLYLDADTMPVQNLDELFDEAEEAGFTATQFGDWVSNSGMPRQRVSCLLEHFEPDWADRDWIEHTLSHPFPSPNGGVFAFSDETASAGRVLAVWEHWTDVVKKRVFIADEACLHVMVANFIEFSLSCADGRWNASPKHKSCSDDEVKIWHFHGDSNVKQKESGFKSQLGYDIWWPVYQQCLLDNVGGVAEWASSVGNRYINKLNEEKSCL